jgi:outer membrane receptor protein involved in Fe transport
MVAPSSRMTNVTDRTFWSKRVLLATTALVAVIAAPAHAQVHQFNIEAQPAQTGIAEFARQADIQILASQELVQDLRTSPVKGQYDTPTALKMLLAGTGLEAQATAEGTWTIVRRETSTVPSMDTIVVTGRAGNDVRTRADTSYSVSVLSQEQLRQTGASSVADTIRTVPGFWVENSGGEGSANIRARGLPIDGFGSVQLEEDGLPVQHDPALGYLNADQSFRFDETIDQVQIVRGGPSSIFNSNAPGGVINYITRKVGDHPEGLIKTTFGDDGLYRADFWAGLPVDGWKLGLGGFYRYESGTRDPGFALNNGGQVRFDASHDLGNGTFDFDYKHLDDKTGFYVAVPVSIDGNTVSSIPGFNANTGSIFGGETTRFRIYTPNGIGNYDLSDGTKVRLDQLSLHATQEIAGWNLDNHFRLRDTDQARNYFSPSSEIYTQAQCLGSLIGQCLNSLPNALANAKALFPTMTSLQLRYADNGALVPANANGNGLVMPNTANNEVIGERELMDDLRVSRDVTLFGQLHDISVGAYVALASENFDKYQAILLTDVRNHARLVDVAALNAAGQVVGTVTDDGVVRYGSGFGHGKGLQQTEAVYAADEWNVTDALRIDAGARWEIMNGDGRYTTGTTLNRTALTNTLATSAIVGPSGIFTPYSMTFDAATWTIGVNYQFDESQGVFARATGAARLPSIGAYIGNTSPPTIGSVETAHSDMYELGYKFSRPWLDLYATAFDTETHNYGIASQPVFTPSINGYVTQQVNGNTRDYGLELDGDIRPFDWFDLAFTGTIQNPYFTIANYALSAGAAPTSYEGDQLLRVPHVSASVSPSVHLFEDKVKLGMTVEYYGSRYADVANTQYLPSYTVVSADARYDVTPDFTVLGSAYNLTNTIGLTEGNARAGEVVSTLGTGTNFVARPIVGRTVKASLLYKF